MRNPALLKVQLLANLRHVPGLLAQQLQLPFKDIDHLVVEHAGASIPWIFDVEGEAGFRARETLALTEALAGAPAVIATGGGIVCKKENRELLKQAGNVVFLYASVEQQFARTRKDKNRPLLQTENPRAKLTELMHQREPWYREVAHLVIETGHYRINAALQKIASYWAAS